MKRKKAACDFKAELTLQERCPKCTLKPPCQHFDKPEQIFKKHQRALFKQDEWLLMSQYNRDLLIRAKKAANIELDSKRNSGRAKSAGRFNYDQNAGSPDTIKSLLMLRLKANQDKNTAMSQMGRKPLSQQERDKIELRH